jgi:Helicase HerA, central domain
VSQLYLGKEVDPGSGRLGPAVALDAGDLLTHGLIVGMTGSGKTGLGVVLIEEALRQGVPVLAIDPKGDLGNLLLLFDRLDGESFAPWTDPESARRSGKGSLAAGTEAAAAWSRGLAEWGLSAGDAAALRASRDAVIYTPGSKAGIPLNVLGSLAAPRIPFETREEDLRDEISALVAGILGLVGLPADPLQSREFVLLANLVEWSWRAGRGLSLESLIGLVADPPFDKIGALPVETVYPRSERGKLMMALNNLLAVPSFEDWREGEPLEVERLLGRSDGRPRLSIVHTAHLSDDERIFVTALLLDKVKTWMRAQPGTTELRALVYMDEVFGYFPPHPANPATKRPLLTLLKQARSQGVGVVLATQNPVDLDYKGLANMGIWLVGRLQTEQDRGRLREGLLGAGMSPAVLDRLLDATGKRIFLLHDVHRPEPCLVHSRWTLSYLRGPMTREEISRLMQERPTQPEAEPAPPAGPPGLPAPFEHHYLDPHGSELADPHLLVKFAVRHTGMDETVGLRAYPLADGAVSEILEGEPMVLDAEGEIAAEPPRPLRFGALPDWLGPSAGREIEAVLRRRLADKLALTLLQDPVTGSTSRPGEDREGFARRLREEGGGTPASRAREKLQKKERELRAREGELSGRKTETWVAVGSAILRNIGLLTGRKKTLSGAGSVLTKHRMENTAEARVDVLRAEVASLEQELETLTHVDPARFEPITRVPARGGVKILRYDLLWVS